MLRKKQLQVTKKLLRENCVVFVFKGVRVIALFQKNKRIKTGQKL
jgi:hypothetical protein